MKQWKQNSKIKNNENENDKLHESQNEKMKNMFWLSRVCDSKLLIRIYRT